ncbi:hypothetical protein [Brevundimonas nasdae]|uniref:hypothetical protein n=1 Tax=Brevundimonas nasdae TaxID=172043 RepID=UPI00289BD2D5|nr:hypothetical protein [Brevundimonas nasdae]
MPLRRFDFRILAFWRTRSRRIWFALILTWLIVTVAAAYLAGATARRDASAELGRQSEAAAALHAAVLRSELEKHRSLPLALATDPEIAQLLDAAPGASSEAINRKLEELARQTRAAVIYVIDAKAPADQFRRRRLQLPSLFHRRHARRPRRVLCAGHRQRSSRPLSITPRR